MGIKEKDLQTVNTISEGDKMRVVTSGGGSRNIEYSDLLNNIEDGIADSGDQFLISFVMSNGNVIQTAENEHTFKELTDYIAHAGKPCNAVFTYNVTQNKGQCIWMGVQYGQYSDAMFDFLFVESSKLVIRRVLVRNYQGETTIALAYTKDVATLS